jgi:hypothetical protein
VIGPCQIFTSFTPALANVPLIILAAVYCRVAFAG